MVHQGYINHVGLVMDRSTSMRLLRDSTVQVADMQIQYLAQRSQEMDQETRATVYQFGSDVDCLFYDKDVLRLPSIKDHYEIRGQTALIDATLQAISDLRQTATLYGDHAFLLYVLTDGQENASRSRAADLRKQLQFLEDNWTVAVFVPDAVGVHEAKQLGFAPGNIAVWNTSERGIREVGETIKRTTDAYMTSRTMGVRGTTGLFQLGVENLSTQAVKDELIEVPTDRYDIFVPGHKMAIQPFVETVTGKKYIRGNSFYELTKPETVQDSKEVMVRDHKTGKVYGGRHARNLLGLPPYDVRVAPASHPDLDIFVQSTSVNRNLVPGTELIVLKK
jgi:hypothetical protein